MNLYLRFLITILKALYSRKQAILTESRLSFRVMPWDCDINLHLTNSRYLSFMDLGRIYLLGNIDMLRKMYQKRWLPVVVGINLSFIKPIAPFQKFTVITQIIGWDEKYLYVSQRFEIAGKIYCSALVKALLMQGKDIISSKDLVNFSGETLPQRLRQNEVIEVWSKLITTKKALLEK